MQTSLYIKILISCIVIHQRDIGSFYALFQRISGLALDRHCHCNARCRDWNTGVRIVFWTTVCKTVALCYRTVVCLSCLSVCDVGVSSLWPNGSMDQDETWHGDRPQPWPQTFRWGPSFPSPKGEQPQFSAHVCCGQTARWIKMSLGREVGLVP